MAKKVTHFTAASLVRLLVFGVVVYLSLLYINSSLSTKKPSSDISPDLPPIVNSIVDSIASSSAFKELSGKISPTIEEIKKLPQKEYEKFKNQLIDELLKRLETTLRSK
ncbi:MAG: hypothetical protein AAB574_01375 [Patescibacteria group bacterium]